MSNQVEYCQAISNCYILLQWQDIIPQSQYGWFLVENLTQCLLETEKKSVSMTNMKMIDQVCYSLCDKFTTITSFCDNLLCKEGSARRYYRHNDTFTFSIYSITYNKYLIIYTALVLLHWQDRQRDTTFIRRGGCQYSNPLAVYTV